jgi:hypothetical protein
MVMCPVAAIDLPDAVIPFIPSLPRSRFEHTSCLSLRDSDVGFGEKLRAE